MLAPSRLDWVSRHQFLAAFAMLESIKPDPVFHLQLTAPCAFPARISQAPVCLLDATYVDLELTKRALDPRCASFAWQEHIKPDSVQRLNQTAIYAFPVHIKPATEFRIQAVALCALLERIKPELEW